MSLTRRATLLAGGGVIGAAAVGWAFTSPQDYIKHVIREHFAAETVSEDDLDLFAADFFDRRPQWQSLELKMFGRTGRMGDATPMKDRWIVRKMREDAIRSFVLGSNAMSRHSMDEPLTYMYFPDPYEAGCLMNWSPA